MSSKNDPAKKSRALVHETVTDAHKKNGSDPRKKPSASSSTKPADTTNGATRKRKRSSPFRVKAGSVVALRFRPELSNIPITILESSGSSSSNDQTLHKKSVITWDDEWTYAWTKPLPGRDEGLALIGKRIRCFFPLPPQEETTTTTTSGSARRRKVLEGEVIRIIDYGEKLLRGISRGMTVELLMDKAQYEHFSFLPRSDADPAKQQQVNETAKRHLRLEETIRGKNKVCVHVTLMKAWWMETEFTSTKYNRWAIQKLVPSRLFHKRQPQLAVSSSTTKGTSTNLISTTTTPTDEVPATTTQNNNNNTDPVPPAKKRRKTAPPGPISTSARHMGDGNDDADQQMNNWRWGVSHYHDVLLSETHTTITSSSSNFWSAEHLSSGFVARVVKVDSGNTANGTTTLAMVTLERLVLPEHTARGRMPHVHSAWSVFGQSCADNDDDNSDDNNNNNNRILLQAPIEQLVLVSKKLKPEEESAELAVVSNGDDVLETLVLSPQSYSFSRDVYVSSSKHGELVCHRCRSTISAGNGDASENKADASTLCPSCTEADQALEEKLSAAGVADCMPFCGCRECLASRGMELEDRVGALVADAGPSETLFSTVCDVLQSSDTSIDFALPEEFFASTSFPSALNNPSAKIKVRQPRKGKRLSGNRSGRSGAKKQVDEKNGSRRKGVVNGSRLPEEDYSVFRPTCARLQSYRSGKKFLNLSTDTMSNEKPRNLREKMFENTARETEREEKTTSGRAARANQRRVMKDVASLGGTNSLTIDTLASREPQLRFDRSSIHAWGVFADEDIAAGEMIIEYRGELIGNTIAEKREKEYEAAKIGSDYMFRVDALNVCDATKQGNVARFINASCGPNCYTKIITLDGNKRIVIYAKRNIRAGEELCYDYKFPLEYDESKRIPCHCGAKECRGFMNWDKRYVALPPKDPKAGQVSEADNSNANEKTS